LVFVVFLRHVNINRIPQTLGHFYCCHVFGFRRPISSFSSPLQLGMISAHKRLSYHFNYVAALPCKVRASAVL